LRRTLMLGAALIGVDYLALAAVDGPGPALALWCVLDALATLVYWPSYHATFALRGDSEQRGRQIGTRQTLVAAASIGGPALGGMLLTLFGPWAAFGAAAAIQAAAIVPLGRLAEQPVAVDANAANPDAERRGFALFAVDAWVINATALAWNLLMFDALDLRFDAFGGVLAAAALAGALGGALLGQLIDRGHARRAVWTNAALIVLSVVLRAACGDDPLVIVPVALVATITGGLYVPTLMTAVYNLAKSTAAPFRFHYAAERGWDCGGAVACLLGAVLAWLGVSLHFILLTALPAILVQALLLDGAYGMHRRAAGAQDLARP
jgi:MFS family permease